MTQATVVTHPPTLLRDRERHRVDSCGAIVTLTGRSGAPWSNVDDGLPRAYVISIGDVAPESINPLATPALAALRDGGTAYSPDQRVGTVDSPTYFARLSAVGRTSGTVFVNDALYDIFGTNATYRWEPEPMRPLPASALDMFTYLSLTALVTHADPHLVITALGNDRPNSLRQVDKQVGRFVNTLRIGGRWANSSILVLGGPTVTADASDRTVSLTAAFDSDPLLRGKVRMSDADGSCLVTWTGCPQHRSEAVEVMRTMAGFTPGVLCVGDADECGSSDVCADLVVHSRPGWRFSSGPAEIIRPAKPLFVAGGAVPADLDCDPARRFDVGSTLSHLLDA